MTNDREKPDVAFLGVCHRALLQRIEGAAEFIKFDIYGLMTKVPCAFFPWTLGDLGFVIAIRDASCLKGFTFKVTWPNGTTAHQIQIETYVIESPQPSGGSEAINEKISPDWTVIVLTPPGIGDIVAGPGRYKISLTHEDDEVTIGWLILAHVPPPPLTPDRIAAIQSNPAALRNARCKFSCTKCQQSIGPYTGLERSQEYEAKGYIWYKDLPDTFQCSCGGMALDLRLMREHFHTVLGGIPNVDGTISFSSTKMYQESKLESICSGFGQFLDQHPDNEEEVQEFIEENPVLLHRYSPKRIWYKAPILASYKTDIVILTHQRELVLIELEKPGTQLLKRDGGMCAELQTAFDQVRDWLHYAEDHKAAVLKEIGQLALADVTKIRGVVIAGRDKPYNVEHLRHLKWTNFGSNIEFLTYDDLMGSVVSLVRAVGNL